MDRTKMVIAIGAVLVLSAGQAWTQGASPTAAKPSNDGAIAAPADLGDDYRVGAGDSIQVAVWKEPDVSTTVFVRPDGKVTLPLINDLEVTGKTPMEIQKIVAEKLSPFIDDPNVTITVREIRSRKVYVLGEVNHAGSFQILQPTTILQMLTEAGGLKPYAKAGSIYLLRTENGKQQKYPFNYKDALKGAKMELNILVQPGDTIVVP